MVSLCAGSALQGVQVTKAQLVQSLRQQSKGFQKASSQFRGVTRVPGGH